MLSYLKIKCLAVKLASHLEYSLKEHFYGKNIIFIYDFLIFKYKKHNRKSSSK